MSRDMAVDAMPTFRSFHRGTAASRMSRFAAMNGAGKGGVVFRQAKTGD